MKGFRFPAPHEGPDTPRVRVLCPDHPEAGDVLRVTANAYGPVFALNASSREEFIGWQPSPEERKQLEQEPVLGRLLTVAVAAPDDGDSQHTLFHLHCESPSCSRHWELRRDRGLASLVDVLDGLGRAGLVEYVVSDLDAFLRDLTQRHSP